MCFIPKTACAVQLAMSALGQKQTCAVHKLMSALPPKADMVRVTRLREPQPISCSKSTAPANSAKPGRTA